MPKLVPVGKNYAIVDDEDYAAVSAKKWWMSHSSDASGGYAVGSKGKKDIPMQRFIMGDLPGVHYDHVNGIGLDNRRCNLRVATQTENMRNCRKRRYHGKPDRKTSSKYKGVWFRKDRQRWSAYIGGPSGQSKREWLGCYATEGQAAEAYNKAAIVRYGEFARLNEIDPADFKH